MSAGSAACRVDGSPVSTLASHSSPAHRHVPPHNAAVQGLEAFRGYVLKHQLVQAQLGYQSLQLHVLLFRLFQPPCLIHLLSAVLLVQTVGRLLGDCCLFGCLSCRLSACDRNLNLTKQTHNLLRCMLLPACQSRLLSFQFASSPLEQEAPRTPPGFLRTLVHLLNFYWIVLPTTWPRITVAVEQQPHSIDRPSLHRRRSAPSSRSSVRSVQSRCPSSSSRKAKVLCGWKRQASQKFEIDNS